MNKKICIEQMPDGTFSVSDATSEESAEMQAQAAAPIPEPQGQQVNSLEEALKLVVSMMKGQPGDAPAPASPFERGFNSVQSGAPA